MISSGLALFFYTIAVFGLAYIMGHAKVSLGIRTQIFNMGGVAAWLVELVECPACLGTHLGFWFAVFAPWVWLNSIIPLPTTTWFSAGVLLGLYTCGTGFVLGRATGWIKGG